ncbi:hypothetical protein [Carboxylicivirga caseinilyticus]|uniref:hypothetical protein n=1 Tax=Carboxylicivirga caseinilyticus TaxID=3417572 RepID=UPI003D336F6C|nr:hypothetical protein [Marinilabiliaceae bacterium A049]
MDITKKRDFIQKYLNQADENIINEFYEILQKSEILKEKLSARAKKSEKDISEGKIYSRSELEDRTSGFF